MKIFRSENSISKACLLFAVAAVSLVTISNAAAAEKVEKLLLAEYINNIRAQFVGLMEKPGNNKLPLYINKLTLELNVSYEREVDGSVSVYVFDAGKSIKNALSQKLSFDVT